MAIPRKRPIKTDCVNCGEDIRHKISALVPGENEEGDIDFMITECEGCGEIGFLMREYFGKKLKAKEVFDSRYPNEDDFSFLNDVEIECLPRNILYLYEEVQSAFETDSSVSASIGIRTLIEAICNFKNINGSNLMEKISNLQKGGFISVIELQTLDKLRLLGNSSAHKMKSYDIEKLNYGLEVVNHILRSLFVLPRIIKKLKA